MKIPKFSERTCSYKFTKGVKKGTLCGVKIESIMDKDVVLCNKHHSVKLSKLSYVNEDNYNKKMNSLSTGEVLLKENSDSSSFPDKICNFKEIEEKCFKEIEELLIPVSPVYDPYVKFFKFNDDLFNI